MKKLLIIPMLFMCSMVIGESKKIIGNPSKIEDHEVSQHVVMADRKAVAHVSLRDVAWKKNY